MKALIIYQKNKNKKLKESLQKFFEQVDEINLKEIHLIIKKDHSFIKPGSLNINNYDFVFPLIEPSLEEFAEPLFSELETRHIPTPYRSSSFYLLNNAPLFFSSLASNNIPIPKIVLTQNPEKLNKKALSFNYPVLLKVYYQQKKIQTILFDTRRSLSSFLSGLRLEPDALLLREFYEKDVASCLVIGNNVFALSQKWNGVDLEDYRPLSLSKKDRELVLSVSSLFGLSLAEIKLCNGKIIGINIPDLDFYEKKTSQSIYDISAQYFFSLAKATESLRKEKSVIGAIAKTLKEALP